MSTSRVPFIICLVAIALLTQSSRATGQLVFTFKESGTGGVEVTGTGSGTATGPRHTEFWDIVDFNSDFLSDTLGTSLISADTVSGTLTNTTTSISESIIAFGVNRNTSSNDDLNWETAAKIQFKVDESYSFSLTAVFNGSTLAYSDLIAGTHIDDGGPLDEIFGTTTINVVAIPEPNLGFVLAGGLVWFCFLITRNSRKKLAKSSMRTV